MYSSTAHNSSRFCRTRYSDGEYPCVCRRCCLFDEVGEQFGDGFDGDPNHSSNGFDEGYYDGFVKDPDDSFDEDPDDGFDEDYDHGEALSVDSTFGFRSFASSKILWRLKVGFPTCGWNNCLGDMDGEVVWYAGR